MTITEKVAYLKGLADGLAIDIEKSKEGKLISVIIDILEEMGMSIEDLEENTTALGEELDAVSDDLADVEEILYEDDEDEDDDECCCGEDDEDFFEVECPNCHSQFAVSDDCDCDDEDGCGCDCGCGHDHDEE
ncbi:CD1247 N-terminal domain-containing protein [Intestinimonas sp. HCP28S3_D6]|uniref:CD1247 N-terminal domain-containing protein n=1 Tax=Intestinimonas sp. HCP28S3_D6 TaxID=3438942 RepID=UPI003F89E1BE